MRKLIYNTVLTFLLILPFQLDGASGVFDEVKEGWKAGVASVIITPEQSMWMAGYGQPRSHFRRYSA